METTTKVGTRTQRVPKQRKTTTQQKKGWNLNCDLETHKALDLLGAWMIGSDKIPKDIKESMQIPKSKVIKIIALEKIKKLGLEFPEVATI